MQSTVTRMYTQDNYAPTSIRYFRAIQNCSWSGSHYRDNRDFTGYLRSRSESFKQISPQKPVLIITTRNREGRSKRTNNHFEHILQ